MAQCVSNRLEDRASEEQLEQKLKDLQEEFDTFRESSAELERELEKELAAQESRAKASEEELAQEKIKAKENLNRVTGELLKCQQELARMKEEKQQYLITARETEEALEQAAEHDRRAQAEVASLKNALDESMELRTFTQTELEDLKATSEELTRHLREELEGVQSELALTTPVRGGDSARGGGGGGENGGVSGRWSDETGRRGRHFFRMTSFDEEEEGNGSGLVGDRYRTPSADGEEDSPRILTSRVGDVMIVSSGRVKGAPRTGSSSSSGGGGSGGRGWFCQRGSDAHFKKESSNLQEGRKSQLRLFAPSPSAKNGSCTTSTVTSVSRSNSSSCRTTRQSPFTDSYHGDSNKDIVPVSSSSSNNSSSSEAGKEVLACSGETKGKSVYDSWDTDDEGESSGSSRPGGRQRQGHRQRSGRRSRQQGCGGGFDEFFEAVSSWRPFSWCQPPL